MAGHEDDGTQQQLHGNYCLASHYHADHHHFLESYRCPPDDSVVTRQSSRIWLSLPQQILCSIATGCFGNAATDDLGSQLRHLLLEADY